MITDAAGRAVAFILAPGQDHELPYAIPLLAKLPGVPKWVVADRGYSSHVFREHIWSLGARPAIPARRNEETLACPPWIYNNRNQVERLWARLKEWRAIATRYEKTAPGATHEIFSVDLTRVRAGSLVLQGSMIEDNPFWSKGYTVGAGAIAGPFG